MLNIISLFKSFRKNIRFIFILTVTILFIAPVFSQDKEKDTPGLEFHIAVMKTALPNRLGTKWRAIAPSQVLNAEQCLVLPDGEVYTEYGLKELATRFYSDGKSKMVVELYQTQFPSEAYGLYTFIRANRTKNHFEFHFGSFLISILSDSEETPIDQSVIEALKANVPSDEGDLPSLPFNLPEQDKIAGTEKYVIGPAAIGKIKEFSDLKNVINFAGGTHAIIANYRNTTGYFSLIIIEYNTPQLATDGFTHIQSYFATFSDERKSTRLLSRVGNYITVAVNVLDASRANSIISQIIYNPKVYWEGKKITDLPIQFRPPDPLAIEEASQTAKIIIRTFYWIGVMIAGAILVGLLTGGFIFYWKRHQRRKLGLDDIFSDAGGTIRLNLDDFLLQPEDSSLNSIQGYYGKEEIKGRE